MTPKPNADAGGDRDPDFKQWNAHTVRIVNEHDQIYCWMHRPSEWFSLIDGRSVQWPPTTPTPAAEGTPNDGFPIRSPDYREGFADGLRAQSLIDSAKLTSTQQALAEARDLVKYREGEILTLLEHQRATETQLAEARRELVAVRAALNCDLPGKEDAETVARKIYHENCDLRTQLSTLRQQNEALRREGEVPRLVDACLSIERAYELLVRLRQSHPDESVRIRAWQECSTLDDIGKEITAHIGVSWRPRAAQQADGKQG